MTFWDYANNHSGDATFIVLVAAIAAYHIIKVFVAEICKGLRTSDEEKSKP